MHAIASLLLGNWFSVKSCLGRPIGLRKPTANWSLDAADPSENAESNKDKKASIDRVKSLQVASVRTFLTCAVYTTDAG